MGDVYTNPPQSRNEAILESIVEGTEYTDPPQSRIEDLLLDVKEVIEQGGGGTTVVANPEGTATDDLSKLQVGQTIYAIPEGTEVEANPQDSASETLSKLKVDDIIYSIPNGGGGGGTSDYTELTNKPEINGNTLSGNKTGAQLGLVDTENGKGLSENDFTDALKDKLDNIEAGAEVNVQADWTEADNTADDFIKNKPNLATVATSGSYNDLSNKPTIPAAQVNADWNANSGVAEILNKPTIPDAVVANPSENATENLSKLKIGNTVYGIEKGTTIVQIPSVVGSSFTYNGQAQGPTITGLDSVHCTITGDTSATNAGSYTFTIALNDPSSMVWSDLTTADKTYSFTIAKASQTISASPSTVSLDSNTQTASVTVSGASTALSATSSDTGVATVSGTSSPITITAVANGSATISIQAQADSNYEASNVVQVEASVSLNITKSVTVYSAASDTLSYTDETGAKTVTTNSSGVGTASVVIPTNGRSVTFTSSVAKNPSNLSQAYSETFNIDANTSDISVMPDNTLYWYGYKNGVQTISSGNGWSHSGYSFDSPTYNTNNVLFPTASEAHECGIGTSSNITISKVHIIAKGDTETPPYGYGFLGIKNSKDLSTSSVGFVRVTSTSIQEYEATPSTSGSYTVGYYSNNGQGSTLYAMWYE